MKFRPFRFGRPSPRRVLIIVHDLVVTFAAVVATFYVRFEGQNFDDRWPDVLRLMPGILIYAGIVYWIFDLYRAKWRFASLPDLANILRAATVLALSMLALDYVLVSPNVYGAFFFGKITIVLYWLLQIAFLAGPRIAYRYFRYSRTQHEMRGPESMPTVIVGNAADAEVLLRSVESGAVKKVRPVGILSPSAADQNQILRGVPVLGRPEEFDAAMQALDTGGTQVARLILTPSGLLPEHHPEATIMRARRMGISVSHMPSLAAGESIRLAPINVEDLLLRPSAKIDYGRLENFVRGKTVVVTGGGGSIGSEICDRVVTFGAARLMVIENSEPALHAALESLAAKDASSQIDGRIADIRDRDRIFSLIKDYRPDLVFHAAALKHVPLLESDWTEAVKTNVFGSINVADATAASGAAAMVMISTDKAIDPVSVLGITKRFAEMYCQMLDSGAAAGGRFVSVRFGNVLASNGSVVPKFKAQIEAGGPVTVTHPDMVRYFMTIREACDLVVTAASHAVGDNGHEPVSVYVLNMGQPVKIVDLAERMIRLVGLEPGRDIDIVFSGIRPGERLNEILFAAEEPTKDIGIVGIVAARAYVPTRQSLQDKIARLRNAVQVGDRRAVFELLQAPEKAAS